MDNAFDIKMTLKNGTIEIVLNLIHYSGSHDLRFRLMYRIFSYSFRGNYSFLDLEIQRSQYINVQKLFKGENYSWAETI